jgi:hypothetical protein
MADNRLSTFLPDDKAAFGVFPQMKPRRRLQDVQGSANVPLDVTRGRLAGLLGLPADLANLLQSPMPTEMFGNTQYEPAQQLPYGSEYFLKNLPLAPTSRVGEVAGQAGAFVPLNPMPAARAAAAGVKALGPTAGRMAEGYLQRQGLMPNIVPEAPQMPLGNMIEKPQAPVSLIGFYSAAEQAALSLPRKSGTGDAFLNDLMKGQDVKKDELSWMGLDDYLKGKPNVTRQEVQDYIAGNRVDVQEVSYGNIDFTKLPDTQLQNEYARVRGYQPVDTYGNPMSREEIVSELSGAPATDLTRYSGYQLPGGENYREILLTLPVDARATYNKIAKEEFSNAYADLTPGQQAQVQGMARGRAQENYGGESVYTSSHFDQPNILAHMRVNDRIDADGKKMLLIEEVQSDWHQAGREKGYIGNYAKGDVKPYTPERAKAEFGPPNTDLFWYFEVPGNTLQIPKSRFGTQDEAMKYVMTEKKVNPEGVPDAPFKGTWHQLALKRALKYAADNGYDRVGLTTGSQQAERYDLSKQISKIYYSPPDSKQANKFGTVFKAFDSRGHEIINKAVTPEELPGIVGKEVAKKLLDAKGNEMGVKALDGIDLQIGGEGMKKYYDEIYPAFFEKQGKKYNAKTGETTIGKKGTIEKSGTSYYQTPDTKATVRYIDISPEMRGGVKKGQPLFTAAPIGGIGLGAGTQDQQQNSINSFIQ